MAYSAGGKVLWTPEFADKQIVERGYVVSLGQFGADVKRHLEKQFKRGLIGKWKACWNAPLGGWGLGSPRIIYGQLELAEQMPTQITNG